MIEFECKPNNCQANAFNKLIINLREEDDTVRSLFAKMMKELEDAYMRIESLHKEIDALREPVKKPTFHERVRESAEFVVNMMNSGKVNPKDVYPKGRYQGD